MSLHISFSIVKQCNLSCPTCAAHRLGNNPVEFTSLELCDEILSYIKKSFGNSHICLYLLSEPLLHPQICEVLDLVNKYGHTCEISSNLNRKVNFFELLSKPVLTRLDVSVSGFTQEVYQRGHAGGNCEIVKKHLKEIATFPLYLKKKVYIKFHLYKDNEKDAEEYSKLCKLYGFTFSPVMAMTMQMGRKLKQIIDNNEDIEPNKIKNIRKRLYYNDEYIYQKINSFKSMPCLFGDRISINYDGNIEFCCVVANYVDTGRLNILEVSPDELIHFISTHKVCKECRKNGFHGMFIYSYYLMSIKNYDNNPNFDYYLRKLNDFLDKRLPMNTVPLYIYGAGVCGRMIANLFKSLNIRISGYIDDSSSKYGLTIDDIKVVSKDYAYKQNERAIAINSIFFDRKTFTSHQKIMHKNGITLYPIHKFCEYAVKN